MLENPCGETPAHTSGPRKDGWTDDQTIRPSKKEQDSKRAKQQKEQNSKKEQNSRPAANQERRPDRATIFLDPWTRHVFLSPVLLVFPRRRRTEFFFDWTGPPVFVFFYGRGLVGVLLLTKETAPGDTAGGGSLDWWCFFWGGKRFNNRL